MKLLKFIYKFYIYNRLEKITKQQLKCNQVIKTDLEKKKESYYKKLLQLS